MKKSFLFFRQLHLNWLWQILTITKEWLVIWSQCVKKTVCRFHILLTETFCNSIFSRVIKNMIQVLPCRFRKCLELFNRMAVEWCCITVLFLFFRQLHLNWLWQILTITKEWLVIWSQCVKKTVCRFHILLTETFCNSIFSRVIKNMIQVLPCRFRKCLKLFNRMAVECCCITVVFRHWSNQLFVSL